MSSLTRPLFGNLTNRFTKKSFSCPSCGQKLRVPIRPGKTLQVRCARCPSEFLLDFKIPLVEAFKWQSGKSLKQNLTDMNHRFWALNTLSKVQALMWVLVLGVILEVLLGLTSLSLNSSHTPQQESPDNESIVQEI